MGPDSVCFLLLLCGGCCCVEFIERDVVWKDGAGRSESIQAETCRSKEGVDILNVHAGSQVFMSVLNTLFIIILNIVVVEKLT